MFTLLMALVACTDMESVPELEPEIVEDVNELVIVSETDERDDMFVTLENDIFMMYLASKTWYDIDVDSHGLRVVGEGLTGSNDDWENGNTSQVAGLVWAKAPIGALGDDETESDKRLTMAARDQQNCGPDEDGDGLGDGWNCWADLRPLRESIETLPYTCKGMNDQGEEVIDIGITLVEEFAVPRSDNCGYL